jgi:hypothetical protein
MQLLLMALFALLLLTVAAYAQLRVSLYTKGGARVMLIRAMLMLVGVAFGLLATMDFGERPLQLLAFLIGFGMVHLPTAVILFVKGRRGSGKS